MNSKQRKILAAVFKKPTQSNILWKDIESLLLAAGARKIERSGSRVKYRSGKTVIILHRPHTQRKEAMPVQVKDVRIFLEKIGVNP